MGANSNIEWTDHTFNPWIGCTKVSPGCANCYAATLDANRYSKTMDGGSKANPVSHWGPGAPRHRTKTWDQPRRWNADEELRHLRAGMQGDSTIIRQLKDGTLPLSRPRVFCASLADWLDDEAPIEWFADLLDLVALTPHLDWLLLSKRPQNWRARLEAIERGIFQCGTRHFAGDWLGGEAPANVWLGTTVEDQVRADERIPVLLTIPARVRFLSCEPLLGPVDLARACGGAAVSARLDWAIVGGESGPRSRPMNPNWARQLRAQCADAGVAFFFKQWGEWAPATQIGDRVEVVTAVAGCPRNPEWHTFASGELVAKVGKKPAGRLLDGREHNELPEVRA